MTIGNRMNIEELSVKSIKDFSKTLKRAGVKKSVLEIFFDSIENLIDPYEMNFNQNIQSIMDQCKFNDMDEVSGFLQKYNDFSNSAVGFINAFEEISDSNLFDKEVEPLFEALYDADERSKSYKTVREIIDRILEKTIKVYDLSTVITSNTNEFIDYLETIFKTRESAFQMLVLMSISEALREHGVDSDDLETMRANFIMITSFVSMLNVLRREELEKVQNNKFFVPRNLQEEIESDMQMDFGNVGRNDPCPCGSGKKYKKCCLNKKVEKKRDPLEVLSPPMATELPLSEKEIDDFYSLWSRLIHFTSKMLCEKRGEKFKKLYLKDNMDKYALSEYALKNNYYLDVRNFLLTNFDRIVDTFMDETRVSRANIDILKTWKKQRLFREDFFIYEDVPFGAIVWDIRGERYFYVHDLYDSLYNLSQKNTALVMLLLPYKGRIIYDGVLGHMSMEFGQNMLDTYIKEYVDLRQKSSMSLSLPRQDNTTKIYQLKVLIKNSKPPIWRRVLIEDDMTYKSLHYIIQNLFEWQESHLYEFVSKNRTYMDEDFKDDLFESESFDVSRYIVSEDLKKVGDKISYVYDFGDDWEHEIKLEAILEKDEDEYYPKCIKGKGRGPMEDIGGIWAYNEIIRAHKEDDKQILDDFYIDSSFDPEAFSVKEVNKRL